MELTLNDTTKVRLAIFPKAEWRIVPAGTTRSINGFNVSSFQVQTESKGIVSEDGLFIVKGEKKIFAGSFGKDVNVVIG